MILSFHPCFEADKNITCAGREPDSSDLEAIQTARAVILPQGCYKTLYDMARRHCKHVFPDFNARFAYPGKIGQAELFKKLDVRHPLTEAFAGTESLLRHYRDPGRQWNFQFPFVFKFNRGGEGEYVFLVQSDAVFHSVIQHAKNCERTGQDGFLVQEFLPSNNRVLRVVVINRKFISYWRVQKNDDISFSSLSRGAEIDADSDPELQWNAVMRAKDFCKKTGINLAGFDFLFSEQPENPEPLFLEINYFFGRQGLGGSENYYKFLEEEIKRWLDSL